MPRRRPIRRAHRPVVAPRSQDVTRRTFLATGAATAALALARPTLAQPADPTALTIAEAGPRIRRGALSSSELVDAYLERIASLDDQTNAYITVLAEEARDTARTLDAELAAGRWRGPLHGIPLALKDNIDTAGVKTTAGSAVFADRVPDRDAEVVTRLEAAGAVVLGKLNLHEFAYGASSAVSHFGAVRNPWDLDRITGGSSGGSGAAVAARLCAGALGTDTGGSIRIPAAHCGVVGLKPTYGLASIRGIVPLAVSLDHVGPLCRTALDAALVLQALAGYDPDGVASVETEVPRYATAAARPTTALRVGVARTGYFDDCDPEILAAVERVVTVLDGLSAGTRDIELPVPARGSLVAVEAYAYHRPYLEADRDRYAPSTLERILSGEAVSAADYAADRDLLQVGRKSVARVFESVDLVVTPTLTALPVTRANADAAPIEVTRTLIRNTAPFNYYGLPTISLPCGFSDEGLPIGVQITGPALGEVDVLALAHAYQQVTDWHRRQTPLG